MHSCWRPLGSGLCSCFQLCCTSYSAVQPPLVNLFTLGVGCTHLTPSCCLPCPPTGVYKNEDIPRVPIICTGNDFSTLYAPLIRDGRMEKYYWNPTREDRIGVCMGIFHDDGVTRGDVEKLVDTFPGQSIDFFGALRARVYDDKVRGPGGGLCAVCCAGLCWVVLGCAVYRGCCSMCVPGLFQQHLPSFSFIPVCMLPHAMHCTACGCTLLLCHLLLTPCCNPPHPTPSCPTGAPVCV
jgi:hypothetical protein